MAAISDKTERYASINEAVRDIRGEGVCVTGSRPVSGGDINDAYLIALSDGMRIFVKENTAANIDFFVAEAEGLAAIRNTGAIDTPDVLGYGTDGGRSFLMLTYIESGQRIKGFMEDFAVRLAAMHRSECDIFTGDGRFGFTRDNYIGAGYQENAPEKSWIEFFRTRRLYPQIKRAERYFDQSGLRKADALLSRLDGLLTEPERPSLIHGDLWAGNYITGSDGRAWLIDPAAYVGHFEAEIAMTELFGGFSPGFYDAYRAENHIEPGYSDRRDIYNLYHMLNHLNLFGVSYLPSVRRIIDRYV